MTPLEQTVLDVLTDAPMTTNDVFYLVPASAADIVTALEQLRKAGEVTHTMVNSVSLWQRKQMEIIR
jgi:hypothetical protein